MRKILNRRNIVFYVSGAYSNPDPRMVEANIEAARVYNIALWQMGFTAICPHTNTQGFEALPLIDYESIMQGDLELVARSDAIYMIPGWEQSKGAKRELSLAKQLKRPDFYDLVEVEQWGRKLMSERFNQR